MTALLNITIHNQKDQLITLRQLQELHVLHSQFLGAPTLRYNQILEFVRLHPQYSVTVQCIGAPC